MDRREVVKALCFGFMGTFAGVTYERYFSSRPVPKPCKIAGTPLDELHTYLCAFHVGAKDFPKVQVEAHHYCMPVKNTPGMFQCVVLDTNDSAARIIGVEYIVSNEMYQALSAEEKKMWHPHDYEVDSGLLVAPGMPQDEEDKFMRSVKGTWGKTVHTWADLSLPLPLGDPILMTSFTKDGQINPDLVKLRDQRLNMDTEKVRKHRAGK